VVRGRSDVRGICSGPRRQGNSLDQGGGKVGDLGGDVQDRDACDERGPVLGSVRIPGENFVQDDLRDVEVEGGPTLAPPCASLVGGQPQSGRGWDGQRGS
jgi:hypothetical protein